MANDVRFLLRDATSDLHRRVDEGFAAFAPGDPDGYRRLLSAHARVVPAIERAVQAQCLWSEWTPRAPLLKADMEELGVATPAELEPIGIETGAAAWGVQYVLEGSKLGGKVLARQVDPAAPRMYLEAACEQGDWLRFQQELNAAGEDGDAAWAEQAIGAARALFERFEQACALEAENCA